LKVFRDSAEPFLRAGAGFVAVGFGLVALDPLPQMAGPGPPGAGFHRNHLQAEKAGAGGPFLGRASFRLRPDAEGVRRTAEGAGDRRPGLNHFEIIETLADPDSPLGSAAIKMLG
jgi:hypothetical protein